MDETPKISERYARMAQKSASEAEAASRRAVLAADAGDARAAKRARREAGEWRDQALKDEMRAHGARSAETQIFEDLQEEAAAAGVRAAKALEQAAEAYRRLKGGGEA